MRQPTNTQRGFTIIELLVAMGIAGILISLIFAVYTRMSVAYQAQNRITAVVQNLRAGQDRMLRELRMAGDQIPPPDYRPIDGVAGPPHFAPDHALPPTALQHDATITFNGVKVSATTIVPNQTAGHPLQPIYVTNGAGDEPDEVRFFYGDHGTSAKVETITLGDTTTVDLFDHNTADTVSPADQFNVDDFVILVNSTQEKISMDVTGGGAVEDFDTTAYEACLLRITAISGNQLQFAETSNFNTFDNGAGIESHCEDVLTQHAADIARPAAARADTMAFRLIGRAYRIDPGRRDIGVLQVHDNGELLAATPWSDLGIGFTNLQIATRWYEAQDLIDQDGDGDLSYEWYSGENQEFPDPTATNPRPDYAVMVGMTLSLETRSFAEVDTPTPAIEGYLDGTDADHNTIGDSPGFSLPVTADPRYDGSYLYRWSTINFEFRNIGRGR